MRGFPRAFWILIAGAFVNRLGGFVIPLLALYLQTARGLSVAQIGVTVSMWGVGSLLAGPTGGTLSDRAGRRTTMLVSLGAGALAMLHLSAARHPLHIAIAAMLLGLFGEMYRPAVSASIADLVPEEQRAQAYGILYWVVNIGFAVAASLGGVLADKSFTLLFVVDASTTLAFGLVIFLWTRETLPPPPEEHPSLLTPLSDARFLMFCALTGSVALIFIQAFVTLPLSLSAHGLSPKAYGALISINGFLIAGLQPFVGRVTAERPRPHILAFAALLVGTGFGATGLATGTPGFAASIVVWSLGEIAMAGIGPAVVADLAPVHLRGAYQGVFHLAWASSHLIGPIAGSQLLGRFGEGALWGACAFVGVSAAIGFMLLGDPRPKAQAVAR